MKNPGYTNTQRFISFGCWNNLNGDGTNLERVISTLKEEVQEKKPEFIIIAGDNYYPYKEEKEEKKEKKREKDISLSVQSSIEPKKRKRKNNKNRIVRTWDKFVVRHRYSNIYGIRKS